MSAPGASGIWSASATSGAGDAGEHLLSVVRYDAELSQASALGTEHADHAVDHGALRKDCYSCDPSLAHDGDEFRQVLHAGLVLWISAGTQPGKVSGLFQDGFQRCGGPRARGYLCEVVQQFHKPEDSVDGTGGHAGSFFRPPGGGHK